MDRVNIIHDLLDWIETHLDQPLLLDNVAAKSGYSKWHLQRMFRSTTGHALGSYIRERRLSQAAQALRSSPRPIPISPCNTISTLSLRSHAPSRNSLAKPRRSIAAPPAGTSGMAGAAGRGGGRTAPRWSYAASLVCGQAAGRRLHQLDGAALISTVSGTKKGSVREN